MYIGLHIQCPLFLSGLSDACSFLTDFRKILGYKCLQNSDPFGAELFHADGQTDRQKDRHDESKNNFSQFFKRP